MPDPKLEIVTIFESDDQVAFELAKAVLDEAGIEYTTTEDAFPGYGFSPMLTQRRRIHIAAYRADEALRLVDGAVNEAKEASTHPFENVVKPRQEGVKYACPCCGFKTLEERGGFEICPVCFWEDDGQDDHDALRVRGGPNGDLSLVEARRNYAEFGACDLLHIASVRKPTDDERE